MYSKSRNTYPIVDIGYHSAYNILAKHISLFTLMEHPEPKDPFFDKTNIELAQIIEKLIFYPSTPEDTVFLYNPFGRPTDFMASHIVLPLELYVTYFPQNSRIKPGIDLPAVAVNKTSSPETRYRTKYEEKYGQFPQLVIDATNTEYMLDNTYYLNRLGQGFRSEDIQRFIDEVESEQEKRKKWREENTPRLDITISEKDSRTVPLDNEDRAYIQLLLDHYTAGGFEDGAYSQDLGIK